MTLDECRAAIGEKVVYRPQPVGLRREEGVITSVNDYFAFVRYGADQHSKATYPGDLEPTHGTDSGDK